MQETKHTESHKFNAKWEKLHDQCFHLMLGSVKIGTVSRRYYPLDSPWTAQFDLELMDFDPIVFDPEDEYTDAETALEYTFFKWWKGEL